MTRQLLLYLSLWMQFKISIKQNSSTFNLLRQFFTSYLKSDFKICQLCLSAGKLSVKQCFRFGRHSCTLYLIKRSNRYTVALDSVLYIGFCSDKNTLIPFIFQFPTTKINIMYLYASYLIRWQIAVYAICVSIYKSCFVNTVIILLCRSYRKITGIACDCLASRNIDNLAVICKLCGEF